MVEGRAVAEVAAELGISNNAVYLARSRVLGQLRRVDLAQRRRIHQIQMALNERGKGVLRMVSRVLPQQIQIACHAFESISPPTAEIRHKIGGS